MNCLEVYENLLVTGSPGLTLLFESLVLQQEKNVEEVQADKAKELWLHCALWNDQLLQEWKLHEQTGNRLLSKMSIGRMLGRKIMEQGEDRFKLVEQMNWKKEFILFDIEELQLGFCETKKYIRVRETPTGEDPERVQKSWDLILFPECSEITAEITRLCSLGVRMSVAIWNAHVIRYHKPWRSGDETVLGEIFLRIRATTRKEILTVVIFHHETVAQGMKRFHQESNAGGSNRNAGIRSYHVYEKDLHLAIFKNKFQGNVEIQEKNVEEDDNEEAFNLESQSQVAQEVHSEESWEFVSATESDTPDASEASADVLDGAPEQIRILPKSMDHMRFGSESGFENDEETDVSALAAEVAEKNTKVDHL